jgi:DMSO/TMAO reductase YedYZ molybdopterin-dependent catalytic subunit
MSADRPPEEAAWVHGHAHEPNPLPPEGDGDFVARLPGGEEAAVTLARLAELPQYEVGGCLIVSTGHGASGPFTFGGVRLVDLLAHVLAPGAAWQRVDVVSADGFGARLLPEHLADEAAGPILLALRRDGAPLTRAGGLVRLIAPGERDDALRQVKWVARIEIA